MAHDHENQVLIQAEAPGLESKGQYNIEEIRDLPDK